MNGVGNKIAGIVMVSTVLYIMLAHGETTSSVIKALGGAFGNAVGALQGRDTGGGQALSVPSFG